jgi:hypothetical protein
MPSGASPSDTDALWDRLGCPRTGEDRKSHPPPPLSRAPLLGLAVSSVYRPYTRTHAHTRAVRTRGKMVLLSGSHQKGEFDWGSQTVNGRLDRPSDTASISFWARAAMSRMRSC